MEMLQQLRDIYSKYVADVKKVYKDAKPMDGLFGWGDDPRKDPCHMRFYEEVEKWAGDFSAQTPDRAHVYEAVRIILETPAAHRGNHCFWFMYAAQGFARDLIGQLDRSRCLQLREFYDEAYPKRDRMPVQREIYKLLKKGAK